MIEERRGPSRDVAFERHRKEFVKFLKVNHITEPVFKDKMIRQVDGEFAILFEGKFTKWSQVKAEVGITKKSGMKLYRKGYSFLLDSGVTKYDAIQWDLREDGRRYPRPYHTLTPKEVERLASKGVTLPYVEAFSDSQDKEMDQQPLKDIEHCFIKMVNEKGEVFTFSLSETKNATSNLANELNAFGTDLGVITSSDYHYYSHKHELISKTWSVKSEIFQRMFSYVLSLHECGVAYNVFDNNCVKFVISVLKVGDIVIKEEAMRVNFTDLFPKPLQKFYKYYPETELYKRLICRSVLNVFGFNRGLTFEENKIAASTENPIIEELTLLHPRKLALWIKKNDVKELSHHS